MDLSILAVFIFYSVAALFAGFTASTLSLRFLENYPKHLRPSHIQKIIHAILAGILLIPLTAPLIPKHTVLKPTAQIWSAPSMRDNAALLPVSGVSGFISIDAFAPERFLAFNTITTIIAVVVMAGILVFAARFVSDAIRIRRLLTQAYPIRAIGKVMVLVSTVAAAPFSIWTPGRAFVVIPELLIENAELFKTAVFHELQHHRQRDTIWLYLMQIIKTIHCWNPLAYLLEKRVSEIQELACDEQVILRLKTSPRAYCNCLVKAAEIAINHQARLSMISVRMSDDGRMLQRRIRIMLFKERKNKSWRGALLCALISLGLLATAAFASQGLVQDRRVSLAEAEKYAANAQQETSFPIVVMEKHRSIVESKLQEYGAPRALMAVPLIESGYRNLSPTNKIRSAGLWQFIESTANHYGLLVNEKVDERLDVEMETDAAIRYLLSGNLRFNDWGLSVLAYNAGAGRVQEGIDATGSRDPWVLIKAGYENDENYLGKIMAAVIIMYNSPALDL